ncbi:nuclear transport factor 2 family protein [Flavitalea flava]
MKIIICLLMLLPAIQTRTFAQEKEEKQVIAAVEALRKAMIDPDQTTLDHLTLDELSYGHSSGQIQDKKEFIDRIVSGKSDFVSIELNEQTVKVVGRTAIVRHHFIAATNDGGKPGTVRLSILLVWQKNKGEWKLLARQAVKLPS